jgi:hypothetical protein
MRLIRHPAEPRREEIAGRLKSDKTPLGSPKRAPLRLVRSTIQTADARRTVAADYLGIESSW